MPPDNISWKSLLNPDRVTIFHSHHGLVLNSSMTRELAVTPEGLALAEALAKKEASVAAHIATTAEAQRKAPIDVAVPAHGRRYLAAADTAAATKDITVPETKAGAEATAADMFTSEDMPSIETLSVVPKKVAVSHRRHIREVREALEERGTADSIPKPKLEGADASERLEKKEQSTATEVAGEARELRTAERAGNGASRPKPPTAPPPALDNGVRFKDKQCAYLLHFVNLFETRRGVEHAPAVTSNWKDLQPGVLACEAELDQRLRDTVKKIIHASSPGGTDL
jgi:hypothetical protein